MDLLRPTIADIPAEGRSLSGTMTGGDLGLTDTDIVIRETVTVRLDLRAIERAIHVTGGIEGTAVRQCVRCLKYFDDPLAVSLHVVYERRPKKTVLPPRIRGSDTQTTTSPSQEEDSNDDAYNFMGDHIELATMLREQVILAAPMQPLCSRDCRG
jgi:uncharacterized protein